MSTDFELLGRTLSDEEIDRLMSYWNDELPVAESCARYYNLFHVYKKGLYQDKLDNELSFVKKLKNFVPEGSKTYTHYLLLYTPGSWCKEHSDDPEKVGNTLVTLLYESDDLEGGDTFFKTSYTSPPRQQHEIKTFEEGTDFPEVMDRVVPRIARLKPGETVKYAHNVLHGVTRVERGSRMVLVSWYVNGEENETHNN